MTRQNDEHRDSDLLSRLYLELRHLAQNRLARELPGQTLTPTALVHETYLRICVQGNRKDIEWDSAAHFFGAASKAMRRILIDNARRKMAVRHGGELKRVDLMTSEISLQMSSSKARSLLELNDSLDVFEVKYPKEAQLVKLRFFGGLTMEEAAKTLGVTRRTAQRYWVFARACLSQLMSDESDSGSRDEHLIPH